MSCAPAGPVDPSQGIYTTSMKLVFVCPNTHKAFETDHFNIIQDNGVKTAETGQRVWDAKVELASACPFCGKFHEYQASELPCPWS
jgi:hypothetical protein